MNYNWEEKNGFVNVAFGSKQFSRFSHVFAPETYNGKTHWKITVAIPDDEGLDAFIGRIDEWGRQRHEEYRQSVPAPQRHKARPFKSIRESAMFKKELRAPDDQSEAVPTGNVLFQAKAATRTRKGERSIPVFYRREGKVQLQGEIPWNSTVVLEVSFGMYGSRWPHDGPPMENAGITCYLNAVRVLAWGEQSDGQGAGLDDASLDALLDETEDAAAVGSAPVATDSVAPSQVPEDPLPDDDNADWENY